MSLPTVRTGVPMSSQASPPHSRPSRWMFSDLLQQEVGLCGRRQWGGHVMGEGQTCRRHLEPQHLYRVVGQVPFFSNRAPLTRPEETLGFQEGTARTSPTAAFPLGPHLLLEFLCLRFPAFGSCYSTGLNNSSERWIFSPSRNSQAISKLFSDCFPCC